MKRFPFMVVMIILGTIFGGVIALESTNNNLVVFGSVLGAISFGCLSLIIEIFLNEIVR